MATFYQQLDRNKWVSALIVGLFITFVTGAVYIMSQAFGYGLDFVAFGLIFSGIGGLISYYFSDKMILGMSGARPANRKKDFHFYTVAENLAMAAQIPVPQLYVIEDTAMNAFATGRDPEHAVVCATTGLLARLNRTELEGVIAHELSHIRNYDTRLMSIVAILVGCVALLADMLLRMTSWGGRGRDREGGGQIQIVLFLAGLLLALFSPIIAQLMQLAISRRREFYADASAAALTKFPNGLISALKKIHKDQEPLEAANKATAHLYIMNPLRNNHDARHWFAGLFNTHPPVEDRIKALEGGL
jgi:heat shock protein HtpX